jgi:hypothetical protein
VRVLVARGGELASIVGPVCSQPGCTDCSGLAALDSGVLIDAATVAERPDVTTSELQSAAVRFLKVTGWADMADPELTAELARDMADQCAEIAGWWPVGTRVRASFNHDIDEWTIIPEFSGV